MESKMTTAEQGRKIEAGLSAEDQSILATGRVIKAAVLTLLVLGITWIGVSSEGTDQAQSALAAKPSYSAHLDQRPAM